MSGHLRRVAEILEMAESKKLTDRRTFVQDLQDIYADDEFIGAITEESDKNLKGPTSWNQIMLTVHRLIIMDVEKAVGKSARGNSALKLHSAYCALMLKTISIATNGTKMFLIFSDLMAAVFQILESKLYKSYHDTFVNILVNYVLPNKIYRVEIPGDQWKDVLKISAILYESSSNLSKIDILDTMRMAVQYGCCQSRLLLDVKRILPFLENVFKDVTSGQQILLKSICRLTCTVIQQIGTESRVSLCNFTEKTLPSIVRLEGCPEKYNLLLLAIQIHHPGGVNSSEDAAYACDWDQWKNIIRGIHAAIVRDTKSEKLSPSFLQLACEVYRQIMQDPSYDTEPTSADLDSQNSQPRKRRRISMGIRKPIDMLGDNDLEITWPLLQILTVLLDKYPTSLKSSDFVGFLSTVTEFVTASLNNELILDSLCELCTVLTKLEKEHVLETDRTEICWEKIWDTIIRALSMNQNEEHGHKLLRSIIEYRSALNPSAFLRLYLTNAVRWSSSSVQTLLTFCKHTPIPDELPNTGGLGTKSETSVRASLVKWALDIPSSKRSTQIPVVSLANLLTGLIIESWYKTEYREAENYHDFEWKRNIAHCESLANDLFDARESKAFRDIERCLFALEFRTNVYDDVVETKNIAPTLRSVHVSEVLDTLIETLAASMKSKDAEEDITTFISKTTLIAKLLSNLVELEIRAEQQIDKMITLFSHSFKIMIDSLTNTETSRHASVVEAVEALDTLYCTRYHWQITNMIVDGSTMDLIKFIFELTNEEDEDMGNDENVQMVNVHGWRGRKSSEKSVKSNNQLSTASCVKNAAHRILTSFCCVWTGNIMSVSQEKVLKNLTKLDLYGSMSILDLRRALAFLETFGMSDQRLINKASLEIVISFLKQFFNVRKKDETAVRGILKVIPYLFRGALQVRCTVDALMEILLTTHKRFAKSGFGPAVCVDFVRCLTEVIRLKPLLKWKIAQNTDATPMIELLTTYIDNPFYIVRLEVIRALYVTFSSRCLDVPAKFRFFNQINSVVSGIFIVDMCHSENERLDQRITRTITAVYVFAAVIRANEFLHSRALRAMIMLSAKENIEKSTIKKALLSVTKNEVEQIRLIKNNLHYLLTSWFEKDYSLQNFPWSLLCCDSQQDFSKKYIDTLLTIKLQRREFKHITVLCTNLGVSFSKTIENCFPLIITLLLSQMSRSIDESPDACSEEVNYARNMYERLRANVVEFEGVKSFQHLLQEKLADVIVDLVKRLHDQEHYYQMFERRVFFPKLNPPNLSSDVLNRCFRLLENDLPVEEQTLIAYLTTERPSVLQKILLELLCNIYDVECIDYKLRAFHQYAYFSSAIVNELSNPYFDAMAMYIVRDASHSLLALIKEEKEQLSEIACTYFHLFLNGALPTRANEIKVVLSFAVSTLIPIIQAGKVKGALRILHFLIVDQRHVLGDAIKKLDAFPHEEPFEEIKRVHNSLKYTINRVYSLEEEIEHFLNAIHDKSLTCSIEGLSHIREQLSERKDELADAYRRLERLRGFAEDCASSTIHRLVYKLVQLTKSSDSNVSLEAAKCLGELGPADLTTMILHPEESYAKEYKDEIIVLTLRVINHLADYLIENNMSLRRASANALYVVFLTSWGQKLNRRLMGDVMTLCNMENPALFDCVYPFTAKKAFKHRHIDIDRGNWLKCLDPMNNLWIPGNRDSYPKWITEITCRILDCFVNMYTESLKPVCELSVEFCEMLLPRLVNLISQMDKSLVPDVCICIDRFFGNQFEELNNSTVVPDSPVKREQGTSYECVRCMLNVVNFMRIRSLDKVPLPLNYLFIAKAAQFCSAYFTSVLYAELWCETLLRDSELLKGKVPGSWNSMIDLICELKPEAGKLLQDIVREAYIHIGDPDSIYGCGLSHLTDSSFRTQHYVHLRQWDKVMLTQDVEMSSGSAGTRGMLNALRQSGLQCLLGRVISTVNKQVEIVDDFMYDTAWRLADWSIIEPHRTTDFMNDTSQFPDHLNSTDYHASHYRALKCLHDGDVVGLRNSVENARVSIVKTLRNTSLECSQTVYPILSQLQMLREIEEFAAIKSNNRDQVFEEWRKQNFVNTHDFQYIEPILSQRLVMYQTRNSDPSTDNETYRALIHMHLEMADVAEKQGYLPIAARTLDSLAKQINLSNAARDQLTYQEAFLAWKRNDQDIGRYLLRNLIKKESLDPSLRAKALRVYGNWMAETKSENPQAVIHKYYEKSIETCNNIESQCSGVLKILTDAQADLAQFADSQYQQIIEFMKSPQYENLLECSEYQNAETGSHAASAKTSDEMKAISVFQRQVENDAAELNNIKKEKELYLVLAARYYLKTLENSDEHDFLIFRLVSLWLDNMFDEELNDVLGEYLNNVPSYKFIPILPQLVPHMSNVRNDFSAKINDLVKKCAMEHPHHTLPVLAAQKNMYRDKHFLSENTNKSRRSEKASFEKEPRVIAAEALISNLSDSSIGPIIREINQLSNALIMLAYYTVSDDQAKKSGIHNIPRSQEISKIRDFTRTIVPTINLDVRPRGNYDNIVGISEYVGNFEIPGGVNAPKKVVCIGTDGIRRTQLVKGKDDIRQDAVMQQVCTVMNSMLKRSKETKRRKLHIRTYKIVPLSQRSGILEWCENTLPISHVLCDFGGKLGMHAKYYPNDWSVSKCRQRLGAVTKETSKVKLKVFLEICENLHPAFQHFFMEKYPSAETWFERRLAYIRSVATTSMVGYMLGLGDRHFSNILIDQTTAEVIHIDFGIAFAQGKVLNIPETVPFRLTRDMEAAMGICGVEGVMRRSCEATVAVLRDRRKILITLLQVLLYDPLFSWAITRLKADDHSSGSSSRSSGKFAEDRGTKKTNKIAERALMKIEQKLKGTEDGLVSSISGQVEALIQQARDPANLCRLYCGWQAYL